MFACTCVFVFEHMHICMCVCLHVYTYMVTSLRWSTMVCSFQIENTQANAENKVPCLSEINNKDVTEFRYNQDNLVIS
jgi:hypothetical protein